MTDSVFKQTKTMIPSAAASSQPIAPQCDNSGALVLQYLSQHLFQGKQEIMILHSGAMYRLRITRQDKLILTK